jgi:hypothetical protein
MASALNDLVATGCQRSQQGRVGKLRERHGPVPIALRDRDLRASSRGMRKFNEFAAARRLARPSPVLRAARLTVQPTRRPSGWKAIDLGALAGGDLAFRSSESVRGKGVIQMTTSCQLRSISRHRKRRGGRGRPSDCGAPIQGRSQFLRFTEAAIRTLFRCMRCRRIVR